MFLETVICDVLVVTGNQPSQTHTDAQTLTKQIPKCSQGSTHMVQTYSAQRQHATADTYEHNTPQGGTRAD